MIDAVHRIRRQATQQLVALQFASAQQRHNLRRLCERTETPRRRLVTIARRDARSMRCGAPALPRYRRCAPKRGRHMQPSTSFDMGRVVTSLRWTARVIGVAVVAFLGYWIIGGTVAFGFTAGVASYVLDALIAIGLVVALFWTGIGEVVGGLALISGAIWIFIGGGLQLGALTAAAPFALVGALFIACGWYTLTRHQPRIAHARI